MNKLLIATIAALSIVTPVQAQYVADYNATDNTLALPWLKVGADYYSNVVLSVPPGQPWSLLHYGSKVTDVPAVTAIFDASTSTLSIPAVSLHAAESSSNLARLATRATESSVDGGLTVVGGVEVSLADGHWAVTRTGTSVRITTSADAPVIVGNVTNLFKFPCTSSGGTTTCTNEGFKENETFGLDTNATDVANGVVGTADQVWKVASGGQCATVQVPGQVYVENAAPASGVFWGDNSGETVKATIYPYPDGDGLYLMSYGNGSVSLSCPVLPVSGVTSVVQTSTAALSATSSTLSGTVGDVLNFYILGGTPPYTVLSENNAIASVAFGAMSANKSQLVKVTLNSAGTTNIAVFDWFQRTIAPSIQVTSTSADSGSGSSGGAFSVSPSSVTGFSVGSRFVAKVSGGTPPYYYFNPTPDYIEVTQATGSSDTYEVYIAHMPPNGGSLKSFVTFYDSTGASQSVTIEPADTTTEFSLSSDQINLYPEMWISVGIAGGVPPFTPVNPNPDWFDVKMTSERVFKVKVKREATVPANGLCAAANFNTVMPVIDSTGLVATLKLVPILQCGAVYIGYE